MGWRNVNMNRKTFFLMSSAMLCMSVPVYAEFTGELLWWVSQSSEQEVSADTGGDVSVTPAPHFDGKDKNPFPVNKAPVKVKQVQIVEPARPKIDYRQIEANKVLKEIRNLYGTEPSVTP